MSPSPNRLQVCVVHSRELVLNGRRSPINWLAKRDDVVDLPQGSIITPVHSRRHESLNVNSEVFLVTAKVFSHSLGEVSGTGCAGRPEERVEVTHTAMSTGLAVGAKVVAPTITTLGAAPVVVTKRAWTAGSTVELQYVVFAIVATPTPLTTASSALSMFAKELRTAVATLVLVSVVFTDSASTASFSAVSRSPFVLAVLAGHSELNASFCFCFLNLTQEKKYTLFYFLSLENKMASVNVKSRAHRSQSPTLFRPSGTDDRLQLV